jgi:hypothetical protein
MASKSDAFSYLQPEDALLLVLVDVIRYVPASGKERATACGGGGGGSGVNDKPRII